MRRLFWILLIISSQAVIVACEKEDITEYSYMSKEELVNEYCNTEPDRKYHKENSDYYKYHQVKLNAAGEEGSKQWYKSNDKERYHLEKLISIFEARRYILLELRKDYGMEEEAVISKCE